MTDQVIFSIVLLILGLLILLKKNNLIFSVEGLPVGRTIMRVGDHKLGWKHMECNASAMYCQQVRDLVHAIPAKERMYYFMKNAAASYKIISFSSILYI